MLSKATLTIRNRVSVLFICTYASFSPELVLAQERVTIQIDKQPGPNPWSNQIFPDAGVDFQFAVISDNTGVCLPRCF